MSEEVSTIRLQKAAKEFNISVGTTMEFLAKKGYQIDNPNSKITEDMYNLLIKEFQHDKSLKQEADKLSLELSEKKQTVTIKEAIKEKPIKEEEEELILIKNISVEPPKKAVKKEEPKEKEKLAPKPKSKPKQEESKQEEPKQEEPLCS